MAVETRRLCLPKMASTPGTTRFVRPNIGAVRTSLDAFVSDNHHNHQNSNIITLLLNVKYPFDLAISCFVLADYYFQLYLMSLF